MAELNRTIDEMIKEIKAKQEELDTEITSLLKVKKRMEKLEEIEQSNKNKS